MLQSSIKIAKKKNQKSFTEIWITYFKRLQNFQNRFSIFVITWRDEFKALLLIIKKEQSLIYIHIHRNIIFSNSNTKRFRKNNFLLLVVNNNIHNIMYISIYIILEKRVKLNVSVFIAFILIQARFFEKGCISSIFLIWTICLSPQNFTSIK